MIHPLLHELTKLQHRDGYLQPDAILELSCKLKIPVNRIYSVATFYHAFRFTPRGKYQIKVCVGSACYVKDAEAVFSAFSKYLKIAGHQDTSNDGLFTLSKVSCLGCCMLAVAVQIDQHIFGHVTVSDIPNIIKDFLLTVREQEQERATEDQDRTYSSEIRVCRCSSCRAAGSAKVYKAFSDEKENYELAYRLKEVSCHGLSYRAPMATIIHDGISYHYDRVQSHHVRAILSEHFSPNSTIDRAAWTSHLLVDSLYNRGCCNHCHTEKTELDLEIDRSRLITQNSNITHPVSLSEYEQHGGLLAFNKSLNMTPQSIINLLKSAKLRGRGGAGFLTGEKWRLAYEATGSIKVVICNADEGDPGAFMDRMLLESFPYRVLEGIMIASKFLQATSAIIYIREEYSHAIHVLEKAIHQLRTNPIFELFAPDYDIILFKGAGAFVCGEETALLESLEGNRGIPRKRPPFPVTSGLNGYPSLINNVETFACIPVILSDDGAAFNAIGTPSSHGTKAFALAGKIKKGGLIEVPIGISIGDIVEKFGGGPEEGHQLKAVMIGGPSGGCIPSNKFDLSVDYETLQQSGAMMGSGGLIALDERDCMVDLSLYFLRFLRDESCGKCVPCREGIIRLCELMEQLTTDGRKQHDLLDRIESLSIHIQQGSFCALGRTAPNMVLSTLHEFRAEFESHIHGYCPAGKCSALTIFKVSDACIGCTKCAQVCAANSIDCIPLEYARIIEEKCVKCGVCRAVCPQDAIKNISHQPVEIVTFDQNQQYTPLISPHKNPIIQEHLIEIDGNVYAFAEGKTLLDYASKHNLSIPTLCHLKETSHSAHCMICAVWDQTLGRFIPSCEQLVEKGHVYQINNSRVRAFRQEMLLLMLNRHDFSCGQCSVKGNCKFLNLLGEYRIKKSKSDAVFPDIVDAKHVVFDAGKCILCHRCLSASNDQLTIHNRGFKSCISPAPESWDHISKAAAEAITFTCPTGALSQRIR